MSTENTMVNSDNRYCTLCPQVCRSKRTGPDFGLCHTGSGFDIASICLHQGEEPVISGEKGIGNIFFNRCHLQCVYCQNYQISRREAKEKILSLEEVVHTLEDLQKQGVNRIGFVSPSHMVRQAKEIIQAMKERGHQPVYVWNSNAYERVSTLRTLEGLVDVYLPDFKYADDRLGRELSGVEDYPRIALRALKEMYRQKGSTLILDDDETAVSGLIIRHLVLPGQVKNSKECLRMIAEELSTAVHLSLMSQYTPVAGADPGGYPDLRRTLQPEEYGEVVEEFYRLGFYRGWTQEPESPEFYNPDFEREHPFEP